MASEIADRACRQRLAIQITKGKINETSDPDYVAACDAVCWLRC